MENGKLLKNDDWYIQHIEEPIRDFVKALRNNGINTICSCGHDMTIECLTVDPTSELERIRTTFMMMNVVYYDVTIKRTVTNNHHYDHIHIKIGYVATDTKSEV